MLLDEDEDKMYLRATKDLRAEGDVFLVDHVWTFKQRQAYKNLKESEKLVERMENIMKFAGKRDLPLANPYTKERPSLEDYLKSQEESKEPVLAYDLDEYGIKELKDVKFREEVEELSLWSNAIENPAAITTVLMKLPNLRALWLNGNPVQQNCQNFNVIGDHFDKLEIFNS